MVDSELLPLFNPIQVHVKTPGCLGDTMAWRVHSLVSLKRFI